MSKKKSVKSKMDFNKKKSIKKSSNKHHNKQKEDNRNHNIKFHKKVDDCRVKKNEVLYGNGDLGLTKQQKFNFDSYLFEDEMDTSFLDKGKKKREQNKNLKKELTKIRKKYNRCKIWLTVLVFGLLTISCFATYLLYLHSNEEEKVVTKIKEKKIVDDNYLFLGDSLTHRYDLEQYYENMPVVNSGVEGDTTGNILNHMKERVYDYNPSKVILLVGTNDLDDFYHLTVDDVFENIKDIVHKIEENRKYTEIYLESLYPINKNKESGTIKEKSNERIKELNEKLKEFCADNGYTYIDVYSRLIDEDENLKSEYTEDGLHIEKDGYEVITEEIKKYILK